jgi:Fe-S-cluster containining protein
LSTALAIAPETVLERYIDQVGAQPMGEWGKFNAKPCPLLKGKLCSVYTQRPETCRLYPQFTPDFRWVLDDLIDGAGLCPIIYNVLWAVHEQAEDIIKNP